jgi:septation ring formation regulator EzrA
MGYSQEDVDLAVKHIAEAEHGLVEQKATVERLRSAGQSTKASEDLLTLIEVAVKMMKDNLAAMHAANNSEK